MFANNRALQRRGAVRQRTLILIIGLAALAGLSIVVNGLLYFAYVQQGRKLEQLELREAQRLESARKELRQLVEEFEVLRSEPGSVKARDTLKKAEEWLSQQGENGQKKRE
jgi:hypothetical protein